MSQPDQEARALEEAFRFLFDLSGRQEKRIPSATRQRARHILKHYPLAAEVRWLHVTVAEVRIAILRRALQQIDRNRHREDCGGLFPEPEGCWGDLVREALELEQRLAKGIDAED